MNNSKIFYLIIWALSLFVATGCSAQKHIDKENIAQLYGQQNKLHPEYKIFHLNDSATVVYYQFNFGDFEYLRPAPGRAFSARFKLEYMLFHDYKAKKIIDSASVVFEDSLNYEKNNSSLGYFEVPVAQNAKYVLRLKLTDLNTGTSVVNIVNIDKSDKLNRQNFYLQAADGLPAMHVYLTKNNKYQLVYRDLRAKKVFVKYFKRFYKAAAPPMNDNRQKKVLKLKADSSYSITMNEGRSLPLTFPKQGIYHIYADSTKQKGFTVFVFTSGYPFVSTPMQMLMPLRYITSNKEFKTLIESDDKKKAVDKFWLDISSNSERAKAMISIYYNRVQDANTLFVSDREGWMTDRGMIFIVYGPPDRVFRNNDLETWVYGTAAQRTTIKFNFIKSINPFTDNDYRLDRSPSYINSWNDALEIWRR